MTPDLLAGTGPAWTRAAPASPRAIKELQSALPGLPQAYFELLRHTNGGEGELGVAPGWFQLWPAETLLARNLQYEVTSALPGWTAIGSNGGGELFVLDGEGRVLMVPFIPMDPEEAIGVADDIPGLARHFGHRVDAA